MDLRRLQSIRSILAILINCLIVAVVVVVAEENILLDVCVELAGRQAGRSSC